MGTKEQLEQIVERVKYAFFHYPFEFSVDFNSENYCIEMHLPAGYNKVGVSFVERFRSIVGEVGFCYVEDHIVLYGTPIIVL